MHEFGEAHRGRRRLAPLIWTLCVALLIGPSALVWILRGIAYGAACAPGPELCRNMPLGDGLRVALDLAWTLPNNALLLIAVAVVATIAGFFARRPLLGALCLLILPVAALILPMLAVFSAVYPGCNVNEAGVGDCLLWGAKMGMSFHAAAVVPWMIYGFAPYSFALALMLGLLGWFFALPRPARPHATARMRSLGDDR